MRENVLLPSVFFKSIVSLKHSALKNIKNDFFANTLAETTGAQGSNKWQTSQPQQPAFLQPSF